MIPIRDHNPTRRFPLVTIGLIAANVVVFFIVGTSDAAVFHYGSIPCDIFSRCGQLSSELTTVFPSRSPFGSVITAMFMHGSFLHLAGNMLYLWVFGNNIEDRLGSIKYFVFYFVCGLAASATHFVFNSGSAIPVVGASGAVSGVLGAYFFLFPKAKVVSLVPIFFFLPVTVSAKLVLGMWFVLQLLEAVTGLGATGAEGGGVAVLAHLGGFAAGYLIVRVVGMQKQGPRAEPAMLDDWLRS